MSEKQRFNKDVQNRQIAEKRRERWLSRKILTEILESVRLQRDDANWILYQVFEKENLTYKSKIKIWNHLMRAGYDLAKEKPEKTTITLKMDAPIVPNFDEKAEIENAYPVQQAIEENHRLYQQVQEANEVVKQIAENWTGLAGREWCPAFRYLEKYNINYKAIK